MQQHPQSGYPRPSPDGGMAAQRPASPPWRPTTSSTTWTRITRVQQACDQCRARKRRCSATQPCENCAHESLDCVYAQGPKVKDDKLTSMIAAVLEKLESVSETVQRVDRAHRTTHQLLFSESKDNSPAVAEHSTRAHNLIFLWQSVGAIMDAVHIDVRGDYVARVEDRPLLDPFAVRPSSLMCSEDFGAHDRQTLQPRPAAQRPIYSLQHHDSEERRSVSEGIPTRDGGLDLSRSTLEALLASYLSNMHILHPFLNKQALRDMFEAFVETFSTGSSRDQALTDGTAPSSRTRKRKRSQFTSGPGSHDTNTMFLLSPQRLQIGNAIIWLVLALGEICAHKTWLPEVFDGSPDAEAMLSQDLSRQGRSGEDSLTAAGSTAVARSAQWSESVCDRYTFIYSVDHSLKDGQSSSLAHRKRNLDVVPGLAYYTAATSVLGSQADGNSLAHAQVFTLAGLYKGQLARVRESISWVTRAGQIVRSLLKTEGLLDEGRLPAKHHVRKPHGNSHSDNKDVYRDAVKLTAWSVLQLESDMLAELSFPPSSLPALELMTYDIPDCQVQFPGLPGVRDAAYDHETVVLFYSAQTFLRTRLNNAHREIYGKLEVEQSPTQIQEMLRGHDLILTEWRTKLPLCLHWQDDEPPSPDILHARLRAKYWGTRYVITRPFLDYVMHILPNIKSAGGVEHVAKDAQGNPREPADIRLLEAIAGMPRSEVWAAVRSCIEAAVQSTVAFDGIPDRLIVTNIHGTAHAQFGNMLVLTAAYQHEHLRGYVSGDRLCSLLDRTIAWLDRLAPISQTCKADCWILQRIRNWLFPFSIIAKTPSLRVQEVKFV